MPWSSGKESWTHSTIRCRSTDLGAHSPSGPKPGSSGCAVNGWSTMWTGVTGMRHARFPVWFEGPVRGPPGWLRVRHASQACPLDGWVVSAVWPARTGHGIRAGLQKGIPWAPAPTGHHTAWISPHLTTGDPRGVRSGPGCGSGPVNVDCRVLVHALRGFGLGRRWLTQPRSRGSVFMWVGNGVPMGRRRRVAHGYHDPMRIVSTPATSATSATSARMISPEGLR